MQGSTAGIRRDSTARGAVGDRLSMLLLVAIVLSSLIGVFGNDVFGNGVLGNGIPAQSTRSLPVRTLQIAQSREGAMAMACRTVRWCSKPLPAPPAMRWMVDTVGGKVM